MRKSFQAIIVNGLILSDMICLFASESNVFLWKKFKQITVTSKVGKSNTFWDSWIRHGIVQNSFNLLKQN